MKPWVKVIGLSTVVMLGACSSDDDSDANIAGNLCEFNNGQFCAVVSVKINRDSADVQIIDGDVVSSGLLPKDQSDYTVAAYGQSFYHLGKKDIDSISKYKNNSFLENSYIANDGKKGFHTGDPSNPYGIAFVSETKAYVPLYALDAVWQINPAATNETDFKVNEQAIDLSHYNEVVGEGSDGSPEAFAVQPVGNEVFVFMQRLDRNNGWAKQGSYAAVFDAANSFQEIDTDLKTNNTADAFKGIELPAQNPISMSYHPNVGFLLAAVSNYNSSSKPKDAGIIHIDPATYKATLLVGDEPSDSSTATVDAAFSSVTIVDKDNAFFVAYNSWQNNDVYHLDLLSNTVTAVASLSGKDIGALTTSPDGKVWVGINDAADPHIQVFDKAGNYITRHSLNQNPNAIAFMTK